ncbi:MAG: hypothetical protein WCI52_00500 [bacterium]
MEPQIQQELKQLVDLTEENNRILKKMQRSAMWANFFQYIRWAIILAVTVGTFYFLQPVIVKINDIYSTMTGSHLPDFQNLLKKF